MRHNPFPDETLIALFDRHMTEGATYAALAEQIGCSTGKVAAALNRIKTETTASDPDGNKNGTMPAKWWREGLRNRSRQP